MVDHQIQLHISVWEEKSRGLSDTKLILPTFLHDEGQKFAWMGVIFENVSKVGGVYPHGPLPRTLMQLQNVAAHTPHLQKMLQSQLTHLGSCKNPA